MSLTFKQFSEAYDRYHAGEDVSDIDQTIVEGFFASDESRVKALHDKAQKGDRNAANQLTTLLKQLADKKKIKGNIEMLARSFDDIKKRYASADQAQAEREKAKAADKNQQWNSARASREAEDRGSSRAYDREAGSVKRNQAPRWDKETKSWVV